MNTENVMVGVWVFALWVGGCARMDPGLGKLDGGWGPGVSNVEVAREKMIAIVKEGDQDDWERVRVAVGTLLRTMTWEQATYLYRTSGVGLRAHLVAHLIGYGNEKFAPGMTRAAIIELLGTPDGDWGDCLVYTGQDCASDSCTPGFLFHLDENKLLQYVGSGP